MDTPATLSSTDAGVGRGRVAAQAGLAVLGAALLGVGIVSTAQNDAILVSVRVQQTVVGCVAVAAALAAAGVARHSQRWTAWLLGLGLLLALLFSWFDESPPVAAVPLLVALVLVLKPIIAREGEPGVDFSTSHVVVSVVSVTLMLPIGLFYLAVGLVVPASAAAVANIVYLMLLGWTIWQARRRSFWAAAGPVIAVTFWFGGLLATEYLFGWTA